MTPTSLAGSLREGLRSREIARAWLALAVAQIVLSLLVYAAVQQDLRQSANDPQIQLAEDAASRLAAGEAPQAVLPSGPVDLARSLAPFMIIYDRAGTPIAGSAVLAGVTPALLGSVLADLASGRGGTPGSGSSGGERRFTWQPGAGVRGAVVVRQVDGAAGGFVLAGRSLREVEEREDAALRLIGLGLAAGLGASLATVVMVETLCRRLQPDRTEIVPGRA